MVDQSGNLCDGSKFHILTEKPEDMTDVLFGKAQKLDIPDHIKLHRAATKYTLILLAETSDSSGRWGYVPASPESTDLIMRVLVASNLLDTWVYIKLEPKGD